MRPGVSGWSRRSRSRAGPRLRGARRGHGQAHGGPAAPLAPVTPCRRPRSLSALSALSWRSLQAASGPAARAYLRRAPEPLARGPWAPRLPSRRRARPAPRYPRPEAFGAARGLAWPGTAPCALGSTCVGPAPRGGTRSSSGRGRPRAPRRRPHSPQLPGLAAGRPGCPCLPDRGAWSRPEKTSLTLPGQSRPQPGSEGASAPRLPGTISGSKSPSPCP